MMTETGRRRSRWRGFKNIDGGKVVVGEDHGRQRTHGPWEMMKSDVNWPGVCLVTEML